MTISTTPPAAVAGGTRPVLLIVCGMTVFAFQDMIVKMVTETVSLWQLQVLRSGATVVLLAAVLGAAGRLGAMRPATLRWPLIRAVFMAGAYLLFYASLPYLTLSQAAAAFFTGPLFITLLAAIMLGERIGPRRIAAVIAGFSGVMMIIRPESGGLQLAVLMPIGAAVCYAVGIIVTRWRCHGETGLALIHVHSHVYLVVGLVGVFALPLLPVPPAERAAAPFLLEGWLPLAWVPFLLVMLTVFSHLTGVLCSIAAYKADEASRLAPFEYTYLAIAPLIDVFVFGTMPRTATLIGLMLIGLSGVLITAREGRPARPTVLPSGKPPVDGAP